MASLTIIVALVLVVGIVSSGVLRHLVQTAPSWLTVYFGLRYRRIAKWTGFPTYIFWLAVMILIWLYLLGLASIVRGHFSIIEIAMTIVVGLASGFGIFESFQIRSDIRWYNGLLLSLTVLILQLIAFRLSVLPGITNR